MNNLRLPNGIDAVEIRAQRLYARILINIIDVGRMLQLVQRTKLINENSKIHCIKK